MDTAEARSIPIADPVAAGPREILAELYGREQFTPLEHQVIAALIGGRDIVLPGETDPAELRAAQIVAACRLKGTAIIVSERLDELSGFVEDVRARYLQAAFLHFDLEKERISELETQFGRGSLKVIATTPAKMLSLTFQRIARSIPISFICLDETAAPLAAERIAGLLPKVPRLSIGPLATTRQPRMAAPTELPTMSVEVRGRHREAILRFMRMQRGNGIIYCRSDEDVVEIHGWLPKGHGIECFAIMDDFDDARRADILAAFAANVGVLAIKTGDDFKLDGADVRWTIHLGSPADDTTMDRELRSGGASDAALMMFNLSDAEGGATSIALADTGTEEKIKAMGAYRKVLGVLTATGCRWHALGSATTNRCGRCDNCCETSDLVDVSSEAKLALEIVGRSADCTFHSLMKALLEEAELPALRWQEILVRLFAEKHILMRKNGVLSLGEAAGHVIGGEIAFEMRTAHHDAARL